MEDIEAAVKEGRAGAKGANKDPRFRRVPKPEQVRVVWHVGQRGFGFGVGCGRLCMRTYTQVPCREGVIEPTPSISQYHFFKKCKPQVIVKEYKEERKSIFNLFQKAKRACPRLSTYIYPTLACLLACFLPSFPCLLSPVRPHDEESRSPACLRRLTTYTPHPIYNVWPRA